MPTNIVNRSDTQVAPFFARFLQQQSSSDEPSPPPSPDTPPAPPVPADPLPFTIKFPSDFEDC